MAERETIWQDGEEIALPVAAATKIELGKLVANNGAGAAVEAADTDGYVVIGVALHTVDNSAGSAGDLSVRVRRGKAAWLENSATNAVTAASIGLPVYVEDDETVCLAAGATHNVVAGICLAVDAARGVLVEHPGRVAVTVEAAASGT